MSSASTRDGTASLRIADALRGAIASGELRAGERIRQEELAARFHASRVPVRNALLVLESERLVTLVANSGAWVTHFDLAECEEMYQMRERIEPLLLRYSAACLDSDIIERMEALAQQMKADTDLDDLLRHDREFHLLSYSGARTVILGATIERVWNSTHRYRRAFASLLSADGVDVMHDEHAMLVRALRLGDLAHAEAVLEGHIRRTRLELAEHPEVFQSFA